MRPRTATVSLGAAALFVAALGMDTGIAQSPSRSTWSGVYSVPQAGRGGLVYLSACAQCHGPDMSGIDAAPPLAGGRFAANWNGIALGDMVDRIRISMPQNDPGSLSRAQVTDVMAYILQQNGFPAGDKELPRQTSTLNMIAYDAYEPSD